MLDEPTLDAASSAAPDGLVQHLRHWLGAWPPLSAVDVVAAPQRTQPAWDGRIHPVLGVADATGATVLSVPPDVADAVREAATGGVEPLLAQLPALLGDASRQAFRAVFRWTTRPADAPATGRWVAADAPGVPEWLHPFGGQVLVATADDGSHLAGVGIKRHDAFGHELAVVTAPQARGRGLGRGLVTQAARHVLRSGTVPTYLHATDNVASAHLADSAGFPDRGWTVIGLGD
ncbi:GNAT family N-acetyltransferase [Angustibacter sp. Root456]|uniref:GNAT family N-acetyltransferase n=1 Tax=Angustibacter sp. Root456 TaxID=1736539 RepID=UPI0006F3EB86|nr:GNAT family N-acetyltransferase [Angustibacter sp. Root456]KQX64387.1 GCN5 family acetyltransferase [Angustibacter sp. Root456]